eukprot:TRINITY_DN9086_c0_g1_i1.p1 TRINITY_DN9086_c0_g1~~TRINITY_DN9086_c0_g1_i1.p1  ORF type:complete len:323 (+),score=46.59 TRINITY_DN9086_c0_g1_i1:117-971(+)
MCIRDRYMGSQNCFLSSHLSTPSYQQMEKDKNFLENEKQKQKRQYIKLTTSADQILMQYFNEVTSYFVIYPYNQTKYPKKDLYQQISDELGFSILKIENWFKIKRRELASVGLIKFPKKIKFSNEQKIIMMKYFEENEKPSLSEQQEIAEQLNLSMNHIKHFFSYQRRKFQKIRMMKLRCNYKSISKLSQEEKQQIPPILINNELPNNTNKYFTRKNQQEQAQQIPKFNFKNQEQLNNFQQIPNQNNYSSQLFPQIVYQQQMFAPQISINLPFYYITNIGNNQG